MTESHREDVASTDRIAVEGDEDEHGDAGLRGVLLDHAEELVKGIVLQLDQHRPAPSATRPRPRRTN